MASASTNKGLARIGGKIKILHNKEAVIATITALSAKSCTVTIPNEEKSKSVPYGSIIGFICE